MMAGLKRGTVALEPHRTEWDEYSKEIISVLRKIFGSDAVDIQHVGSTAIAGILAKPIIDLAVAVENFHRVLQHQKELEDAGIIFRGKDIPGQLLFVIGDFEKDTRSCHIHVVKWNAPEWKNYLNFRDYLNTNPEKAQEYSMLKERLASEYPDDRIPYTNGKQRLIDELLEQAAKWRETEYENLYIMRKYEI